jgi:type IV secretory pathway VirJ component
MNGMKRIIVLVAVLSLSRLSFAQSKTLPLSIYKSTDTTKPLIFYMSGDGGFNKFSVSFMKALNKSGYTVMGLNSKEYFWSKKKPQEAANAIEQAIIDSNKHWKKKNILFIGYSFGADVAPFMLTHFSPAFVASVDHLFLLSPSDKTDFEVHLLQMMGWGKNEGQSVPAEINKISKPVIIITGDDEKDFPFNELTIKNKKIIKMPGGHHYDGDIDALCKQIISQSRSSL